MKKIYKRKRSLKIINQDDGAIIFDKKTGEYFQTNELGKTVCEMYISKLSLEQIANYISDNYDVTYSQALLDVEDFFENFIYTR